MANVWVGDDYYISNVHIKTEGSDKFYGVEFQRLPEADHTMVSMIDFKQVSGSRTHPFPPNLGKDAFLANALPKINAAISIWDAASTSSTGW